jgi:ABC-type transporter MlaC component
MRLASLTSVFLVAFAAATVGGTAGAAEDPQNFVQRQTQKLSDLLRQPKTGARDTAVQRELDAMVDYDELTRRAFGDPCPTALPACTNDWTTLGADQKKEVSGLLKQLIQKNYQKNIEKTLDYEISYKGEKADSDSMRIRTEAKSKTKPRDPVVQIDYVVRDTNGKLSIVDIITEGTSLTKSYYEQFDKKLKNTAEGYPNIVQKLKDRIAQL